MIEINTISWRVYISGTEVDLSHKQFRLLLYFARHLDHMLTRDRILNAVWGEDIHVEMRAVDSRIAVLKRRLGKHGAAIETIYGEGYRFNPKKCQINII